MGSPRSGAPSALQEDDGGAAGSRVRHRRRRCATTRHPTGRCFQRRECLRAAPVDSPSSKLRGYRLSERGGRYAPEPATAGLDPVLWRYGDRQDQLRRLADSRPTADPGRGWLHSRGSTRNQSQRPTWTRPLYPSQNLTTLGRLQRSPVAHPAYRSRPDIDRRDPRRRHRLSGLQSFAERQPGHIDHPRQELPASHRTADHPGQTPRVQCLRRRG
ncbi:hypothetical protein PAERUG_P64_East_of_England_6_01_14_02217 [Pseudomonas aeruginosa]|nr:hypothetical protein PAERUG_P64_East_of_England_6_01_14_02217 [Pseudomonas aeruginosa]